MGDRYREGPLDKPRVAPGSRAPDDEGRNASRETGRRKTVKSGSAWIRMSCHWDTESVWGF